MSFKKILAGLDDSPLNQLVFNQALELAKDHEARLMLFHCLTADVVLTAPSFSGDMGLPAQMVSQAYQSQYITLEAQTRQVQQWLQHYSNLAMRQGVSVEYDYKIAAPGQGLCQAAKHGQADLIVLGRRGRKGLTEMLLGSVSNYVLHHADCAVLVVQLNHLHQKSHPRSTVAEAETAQSLL